MRKTIISLVLSAVFSLPAAADELKLQDNPPDRYVVVKGDTLWDISGRFLKEPWRWPEIWNLNREEIKNPHWIYPGDVVVLDRSGGSARLRLVKGEKYAGGRATVKLSPQIRSTSLAEQAIPAIPPAVIEPFVRAPLVVSEAELEQFPQLVATEDARVILGAGDRGYVDQLSEGQGVHWRLYRPGKMLKDPDTDESLGYEALDLGVARVVRFGSPATVEVVEAKQEINAGDRIFPVPQVEFASEYVPHAPQRPVQGSIISAYGGVSGLGQYAIIGINRGREAGLEKGHVLAIYRKGATVPRTGKPAAAFVYGGSAPLKPGATIRAGEGYDPGAALEPDRPAEKGETAWTYLDIGCLKPGAKVSFGEPFEPREVYQLHCREEATGAMTLPDERAGLAMVFRVFDRVSYALVLNTSRPLYLLDVVKNP